MKHFKFVNFLRYALFGGLFLLGLRFLLPISLPFLLAGLLALTAEKAVAWMHARLKLPRPVASAIGVSGVFLLLVTFLTLALAALVRQLPRLTDLLPKVEDAVLSGRDLLQQWLLSLAEKFPGTVGTLLSGWAKSLFTGQTDLLQPIMQQLPRFATNLAGKMGEGMFGLLTGLIASFMLSIRLPHIQSWLKTTLPDSVQLKVSSIRQGLGRALGGWAMAQLKLAAMTFVILCIGFFLLRINHALLWAFLITLVDAFPVLGVGTVLLPWALVSALQHDYTLALGLIVVYVAAWLLRSLAEPKLVGKGLGLDPLITLIVIYAGFRLGGIGGMLLAPIAATAAVQIWKGLPLPKSQKNQG